MRYFFLFLLSINQSLWGQEAIEVADLNFEIGSKSSKTMYYVFDAGDEVFFSFSEKNGKEVSGFRIKEYPNTSKFEQTNVVAIKNKSIKVTQKSVYVFELENNQLLKNRHCSLHIARKPSQKGRGLNFNTSVKWRTMVDTVWPVGTPKKLIGHKTQASYKTERVLSKIDTLILPILERTERVDSRKNIIGNNGLTEVKFNLPNLINNHNEQQELINWTYWIGVGDQSIKVLNAANTKAAAKAIVSTTIKTGLLEGPYAALAVLAVEGVNLYHTPPDGDNVIFKLMQQGFTLDKGNSVVAYARKQTPKSGEIVIEFANDNYLYGLNVNVKIIAVLVSKKYQNEVKKLETSAPIYQYLTDKKPEIVKIEVPEFAD